MKFITDDFETPKAEKLFVDRVEPRQLFWQHYQQAQTRGMESPAVLCYYGVGGIGKTALNRQLRKELEQRYPKAKYLELDFDFVERREPYRILALMRKKLADTYGFSFPIFDVAYYSLMTQMGEEINKPESQSLIGSSPVLSFILDSAGFIPGVDAITSIMKLADDGVVLFRNCFSSRKSMLNKLKNTEPRELLEELPIYFAADLREQLAKEKFPVVIFIDTYEKLVNELSAIGSPLQNDLWLRGPKGILQRLPGVIWVISGREKLKWEQLDAPGHWDGVLYQYLLGTLSAQDAAAFLENAGVADRAVQSAIYRQTEGLPVYLDLCVEQYLQSGSTELDVRQGVLFERCTRYMNDQEKNILFLLACLGTWTDASAYAAGKQMPFDFSPVFYEKLLNFSFIQTGDGVHYTLMRQMAEALLENCPAVIRRACMELMVQADTAPAAAAPEAIPVQPEAAAELEDGIHLDATRYMQLRLADVHSKEDLGALIDDLQDRLCELEETYQLSTFYDYLAPMWQLAQQQYPQSRAFARLQTFYSMGLYRSGDYEEAEHHGLASLALLRDLRGNVDDLEAALGNIANQYGERYMFSKIPPLLDGLWEEVSGSLGQEHQVAQEIAHLIAAAYETMEEPEQVALWRSRYDVQAMDTLAESCELTEYEQELAELNAQAETLWEAGSTDDALERLTDMVNRAQELLGVNAIPTINAIETLAEYHQKAEYFTDAVELQELAVQRYTEVLGLHDNATALARMALCGYLSDAGHSQQAIDMADEVIADLHASFGLLHSIPLSFRFTMVCEKIAACRDTLTESGGEGEALTAELRAIRKDMGKAKGIEAEMLAVVDDTVAMLEDLLQFTPKQQPTACGVSLKAAQTQRRQETRHSDLWLAGDAPEKRVKNAVAKFGRGVAQEDILLFLDSTVSKNGKRGALFTKDTMYFQEIGDSGAVPITDIEAVEPGKTQVTISVRGRRHPVEIITAQETAIANILRSFLGLSQ